MTDEKFENLEINVSDKDYCAAIEIYIRNNLSTASISQFKDAAEAIGIDRDGISRAAGEALFNEMVLQAMIEHIEMKQKENENAKL